MGLNRIGASARLRRGSRSATSAKKTIDPSKLEGARKAALPATAQAELATLVTQVPEGDQWLHEIKFDGYRILARIQNGRVRLVTRNGQDWTERLEPIAEALGSLPVDTAITDGEVVALDAAGISDFQKLQNSLSEHEGSGLVYQVFDLLHLDGWSLMGISLKNRKAVLAALAAKSSRLADRIRYSDHVEGRGAEFYAQACKFGLEGLVSKRSDSLYKPGRQRDWLKTKCLRGQEFVIGGFTDPTGSRHGFGSLLLGYYDGGALIYAGRVGTGFTQQSLEELHARLARLRRPDPPFQNPPHERGLHWVEPKLVAEVEFLNWTRDGMLRHPTFRGTREDKKPGDVVREQSAAVPVAGKSSKKQEEMSTVSKAGGGARPRVGKRVAPSAGRKKLGGQDARRAAAARGSSPDVLPGRQSAGGGKGGASRRANPANAVVLDPDTVAGVRLTNPDRVLYPDVGVTKRDVALYYASVASVMLPHVAGKPLMLRRCPQGVGKPCFYQKHAADNLPPSIRAFKVPEQKGSAYHVGITDETGLISMVQMSALEIHLWGAKADQVERPVVMVFDLDPDPAVPWTRVIEAASALHTTLAKLDLESFVMTTGGKGLHVTVPLRPLNSWDEVREASRAIAEVFSRADPTHYTSVMSKSKRTGRIFIDYFRNARGATAIAPYSTRARPGAAVAAPLAWRELPGLVAADRYTVRNFHERRKSLSADPWTGFHTVKQTLTKAILKKLGV